MTWNIFKRVAELEQKVKDLYQVLSMLHNQIRAKYPSSEVDEERERKLQHRREQYAKNKADKMAKAKHNARQKAYRARQKEKQNA
jgi:regulator of replication initiation timing